MKRTIKLSESELRRMISESVKRVLNEIGDTDDGQNALGQVHGRAIARADHAPNKKEAKKYNKIASDALHKAYDEGEKNNLYRGIGSPFDKGINIGYHKM